MHRGIIFGLFLPKMFGENKIFCQKSFKIEERNRFLNIFFKKTAKKILIYVFSLFLKVFHMMLYVIIFYFKTSVSKS